MQIDYVQKITLHITFVKQKTKVQFNLAITSSRTKLRGLVY